MNLDQQLRAQFGFSAWRPGQREVVSHLLGAGRALAVFPTGGGKSLCYQFPATLLPGTTLVVSPLIALMQDQVNYLLSRGVAAAGMTSAQSREELRAIQSGALDGSLKVLFVAPERFNNERFLDLLGRMNIALFAIDEAHCISEWGHNFRPDYLKLAQVTRDLNIQRILALTATATPAVAESICREFSIPPEAAINTGYYRPNLEMLLTPTLAAQRLNELADKITGRPAGPGIVYVTLQKTAEEVAAALDARGIAVRAYHAGLDTNARAEIQDWWMAGEDRWVVATIAFGMGIDKANVRYVYHYNLPKGLESYSQEIGRAGRDQAPSVVELLACPDDIPILENFAFGDTPTEETLRDFVQFIWNQDQEFAVKETELSTALDMRSLVLRTALTYLELHGVIRQGTPFYAGYEFRPVTSEADLLAAFGARAQSFVEQLLGLSQKGRIWYRFDSEEATQRLATQRRHLVRAMELMEEKGVAEVRATDPRQRYYRLDTSETPHSLAAMLHDRFTRKEEGEIQRIQDVVNLVEAHECQTNVLARYFGQPREEPCGHCSWCLQGRPAVLPAARHLPPLSQAVNAAEVAALRAAHPAALAHPRQLARFLCGLTSPAQTRARIGRHSLFGSLAAYRFRDVLAWAMRLE